MSLTHTLSRPAALRWAAPPTTPIFSQVLTVAVILVAGLDFIMIQFLTDQQPERQRL